MSLLNRPEKFSKPETDKRSESKSILDKIREHKIAAASAFAGLLAVAGFFALNSGGEKNAPAPEQPVATAPATPGEQSPSPEASQPTVESIYSAEDQAALAEISAMSIEDITGEFSKEDLDINNIADTFSDPFDTPTTSRIPEQEPDYDKAFDVNAFVISQLASADVSPNEKTELLSTLGLGPVALRETLETCLKVANGEMDSYFPWTDARDKELINVWRSYGVSFYAATLSAIQNGAEIPASSQVSTVDEEIKAGMIEYGGTPNYKTNFGKSVNGDNAWIIRLENGDLTNIPPTVDEALSLSFYNAATVKYTASALNIVTAWPYNPTNFVIEQF